MYLFVYVFMMLVCARMCAGIVGFWLRIEWLDGFDCLEEESELRVCVCLCVGFAVVNSY